MAVATAATSSTLEAVHGRCHWPRNPNSRLNSTGGAITKVRNAYITGSQTKFCRMLAQRSASPPIRMDFGHFWPS